MHLLMCGLSLHSTQLTKSCTTSPVTRLTLLGGAAAEEAVASLRDQRETLDAQLQRLTSCRDEFQQLTRCM